MKNILSKKCIVCGKKLTKKQKKFCSRDCFYRYQNKSIKLECNFCGKEVIVKNYRKDKISFCSHNCYSRWMIGKSNESDTKFKKEDR